MNSEKSSTTRTQKNQTHEPMNQKSRDCMNPWTHESNPWTQESNPWKIKPMNRTHEPMNQTHESNPWKIKPTNPWIKIERKRDSGLEREKKSEIDKERSKRTIQTQTTQTSKNQRQHAVPMLPISSTSSSSFFSGRSPLLILLGWSSSLYFFSAVVWDIFQPTQFESKSSQIERDKD